MEERREKGWFSNPTLQSLVEVARSNGHNLVIGDLDGISAVGCGVRPLLVFESPTAGNRLSAVNRGELPAMVEFVGLNLGRWKTWD